MKTISMFVISSLISFSVIAQVNVNSCSDNKIQGGVDVWPWSVAQPFPWENIEGYWKLGDDNYNYIHARVLSSTKNRQILSLTVFDDGICDKPYAKGTGYIDITDKNVVRALVTDGVYKYQLKLGMFNSRDLTGQSRCAANVMALSIQVISRVKKANDPRAEAPLDPIVTEIRNTVLKKVALDADKACKK